MSWFEIKVEIERQASEGAANFLIEQGSPGVKIEDSAYFSMPPGDDVIGKGPTEGPDQETGRGQGITSKDTVCVLGYFPEDQERIWEVITGLESFLLDLEEMGIDPGGFIITCKRIEETDWAESWKQYYHPVEVSGRLVIVPSWIQHREKGGQLKIELDPGMAFGSGTHPTTLMCLWALERCDVNGSVVYDLGCGSGILSAAAAKMGAAKVIAVDFDPISIKAAGENCRQNQVTSQVEIFLGELPSFLLDKENLPPGDIIMGNLTADLIIKILPHMSPLCREGTRIIFSGIIQDKLEDLLDKIQKQGYQVEETMIEKDWVTLQVVKERGCQNG